MEWLIAVWNRINKPLHYILVGGAILLFAPSDLRWTGFIFAAVGLAGAIEWIASCVRKWITGRVDCRELKKKILSLNSDEKAALRQQLERGEQTFYLNWNYYHGINPKLGDENEYRHLAGIYTGLAQKHFLSMRTDHTIATLHVTDVAWAALQREYKENASFLSP